MGGAQYIISKIDGQKYCKTNGQFGRHLKANQLTHQDYYELYVTGKKELCSCGKSKTFYPSTATYANSCGDPVCVGKLVHITKQNWTEEQRRNDSQNKRRAAANRTEETIRNRKEKIRQTSLQKYGTEAPTQSEEFKAKSRQSKKKKYGNEYYSGWEKSAKKNRAKTTEEQNIINEKRRITNLQRHGVENCFLKPGITRSVARGNTSIKEYILPSNKIIGVRGYENLVIDILLEKYREEDLIIHDNYSNYGLPSFSYVAANRHIKTYHPDIHIPSENKIIEVKSEWWWDGKGNDKYKNRLVNNLKKKDAVLAEGYIYEVWLFRSKDDYRILKWENSN